MARESALVLLAAALSTGCFSSPGGDSGREPPTLVGVAPADFLGKVPCANAPGALRSYVVRLWDHGTEEEPLNFELAPSVVPVSGGLGPVPCNQTAVFGHVVPQHRYSAVVEAYDRTDLKTLGGPSSILVDPEGNFVAPRWTTRCGRDEAGNPTQGSVVSAAFVTRFVRGCAPLASGGPPTDTAVTLNVADIAGAPGCGSAADQIERFRVRPSGDPAAAQEAACGELITFSPLSAGKTYLYELFAFEGGQTTASWGTTCWATALDGATVAAECDPLFSEGVLEIDLETLFGEWGTSCAPPGDLVSVTATLGQDSITSCESLRFEKLAPGSYSVSVSTERADQTPGPGALCSAAVEPGVVTVAACTPLPATP